MNTIQLKFAVWKYNPKLPLGPEGSFGEVYIGQNDKGEQIAVKRLKITAQEAAHRELSIANKLVENTYSNVMPILDFGQCANSDRYFIVMPCAEKSLQDFLDAEGHLDDRRTANILLEIANGLEEVSDLVHRDLKLGNVLLHEGCWKVADFGIARFVGESTSLHTLKTFLSPAYAAPEQWRHEHVTSATDVYALGCIGFALLTGNPPFIGPEVADFKSQHINDEPPALTETNPQLRSILSMMLRKTPKTRPSIQRVKLILTSILAEFEKGVVGRGRYAMAQAGANAAEQEARNESAEERAKIEYIRRYDLTQIATSELSKILHGLGEQITALVPTAKIILEYDPPIDFWWWFPIINFFKAVGHLTDDSRFLVTIKFESIYLEGKYFLGGLKGSDYSINTFGAMYGKRTMAPNTFERSGWDVICGAQINLFARERHWRGASLWYTDVGIDEAYRWYEVSYIRRFLWRDSHLLALPPNEADATVTSSNKRHRIGFGPQPIDDEDMPNFCDRWLEYLNNALDVSRM